MRYKRVQIRRLAGAYWLISRRSVLLGADTLGELRTYWRENVITGGEA